MQYQTRSVPRVVPDSPLGNWGKPKRSLMSNAASSAGGQDDADEEEEDPLSREMKL